MCFNKRQQVIALFAVSLLVISVLLGCGTYNEPYRGKLSEAMRKSSENFHGERKVYRYGEDEKDWDEAGETQEVQEEVMIESLPVFGNELSPDKSVAGSEAKIKYSEQTTGFFGLGGGTGLLYSDDFAELVHVDLAVGAYVSDTGRGEMYAGCGWASVRQTSSLEASLKSGVYFVKFGLRYKYFFTPRHTFLGPYIVGNLGYQRMFWTYKNAIVTEDHQSIRYDNLGGAELSVGLGLNMVQTKKYQFGIEAAPSLILWHDRTNQGFDNDVFDPFLMLNLRMTLTFLSGTQ